MAKDHYKVLGVSQKSTANEIRKAYLALALKYHPDKNKTQSAKVKFQEVQQAYDTLSDPQKRATYNLTRVRGSRRNQHENSFHGFESDDDGFNPMFMNLFFTNPLMDFEINGLNIGFDLGELFSDVRDNFAFNVGPDELSFSFSFPSASDNHRPHTSPQHKPETSGTQRANQKSNLSSSQNPSSNQNSKQNSHESSNLPTNQKVNQKTTPKQNQKSIRKLSLSGNMRSKVKTRKT